MIKWLGAAGIVYALGMLMALCASIMEHEWPGLFVMIMATPVFISIYKIIKKLYKASSVNKPKRIAKRRFFQDLNLFSKILLTLLIPALFFIIFCIIVPSDKYSNDFFEFCLYFYFVGVILFLRLIWRKPKKNDFYNESTSIPTPVSDSFEQLS